jgi:hypothetical protein
MRLLTFWAVLLLVYFTLIGCAQTNQKTIFVPVKSNPIAADCIIKNPDGGVSLAVCPKPLEWSNI